MKALYPSYNNRFNSDDWYYDRTGNGYANTNYTGNTNNTDDNRGNSEFINYGSIFGRKGRNFGNAGSFGNFRNVGSKLGNLYSTLGNNINWSRGSGINAYGYNLGGAATKLGGLALAGKALGKSQELNKSYDVTQDLINKATLSANSNPLVNSYLTSNQRALLNKAKNGYLASEGSISDYIPDDASGWGDAIKAAVIGYVTGGIPGAVVGGLGTAANSGLESAAAEQAQQQAELEALLMALEDAELQYQSMRRPPMSGLGIQQRYQNMYA